MGKTRQSANLVSDNNIFSDITNDRVGIKTDSPAYDLDVKGDINLSGNLYQDGTPFSGSVWTQTDSGINAITNVGVGTTNPRFQLEVGAVGAAGTQLYVNGDARVTGILSVGQASITIDASDNSIKLSNDAIIRRDNSTGDIRFLDSGGNLKKIIANEIRVGSGADAALIKRRDGKVVFEDNTGQQVAVAKTWTSISSGVTTTLVANTQYLVDTSSGVTTTYLPASPQMGEYIVIADSTGSFGINTCFIVQNNSATGPATYIHGSLESLEADVQYAHATLIYTGISTTGWLVK